MFDLHARTAAEAKTPEDVADAPLSGTRAQSIQRLQVGLSGLVAMVLIVGLANVIISRARQNDANVVPEAASTIAAEAEAAEASDPLADAGVVPEIPPEPTGTPVDTNMLPDSGDVAPSAARD